MRKSPNYFYAILAIVVLAAGAFTAMLMLARPIGPEFEQLALNAESHRTAQAGAEIAKCKAGDASACFVAGTKYESGHGVPRDPQVATDYFIRACDMRFAGGCAGAAQLNVADTMKSEQFLRKACDLADQPSCSKLAKAEKPTPKR